MHHKCWPPPPPPSSPPHIDGLVSGHSLLLQQQQQLSTSTTTTNPMRRSPLAARNFEQNICSGSGGNSNGSSASSFRNEAQRVAPSLSIKKRQQTVLARTNKSARDKITTTTTMTTTKTGSLLMPSTTITETMMGPVDSDWPSAIRGRLANGLDMETPPTTTTKTPMPTSPPPPPPSSSSSSPASPPASRQPTEIPRKNETSIKPSTLSRRERRRTNRLSRHRDGAGLSLRRALGLALVHQIVIISLILHRFPPLGATPTTDYVASGSSTLSHNGDHHRNHHDINRRQTSNNHFNNQLQQQQQQLQQQKQHLDNDKLKSQLQSRWPIYAGETPGDQDAIGELAKTSRQRESDTSERQQQDQQTKAATAMMMMTMMAAAATDAEDENNGRLSNQRERALSFMNRDEITSDEDGLRRRRRTSPLSAALHELNQHSVGKPDGESRFWRDPARRHKRHMGAAADSAVDSSSDVNAETAAVAAAAVNQHGPRGGLDCHKLAPLWLYLQATYPALSRHLVELASAAAAAAATTSSGAPPLASMQNGDHLQSQSGKSIQLARTIGDLLGDAERITLSAQHQPAWSVPSNKLSAAAAAHQRGGHSPAWLSRVSSNQAYNKLVQHLRAKQRPTSSQQQQQQQHLPEQPSFPSPTTTTPPPPPPSPSPTPSQSSSVPVQQPKPFRPAPSLPSGEPNWALSPPNAKQGDGAREHMAGAARTGNRQSSSPGATQEVETFGWQANYPREIGQVENSNGVARTLEKLHLLKQQRRPNQLVHGDIVETNRISLPSDEVGRRELGAAANEWPKSSGASAADLARNNYVYGTMRLKPDSLGGSRSDQVSRYPTQRSASHGQRTTNGRSMSALREFANEQERQQLALLNTAGDGVGRPSMASGENNHRVAQPEVASPSLSQENHVTRVFVSPPSDNLSINNIDKSSKTLSQSLGGDSYPVVAPAAMVVATDTDELSSNDELISQQRSGQMAINGGDGELLQSAAGDDEFEGEFHSGPLKQVEVRLLRSLDQQQQQQQHQRRPITSLLTSGSQQQDPAPAVELVTASADIVID